MTHERDGKYVQNFSWKTEGRRPLRKSRRRCADNNKISLKEIERDCGLRSLVSG